MSGNHGARAILAPFTPAIDAAVAQRIEATLQDIEAAHDTTILFAVESGSRAWGFPSPDSDYDVRFVSVQRLDWYLSLTPGRDVIERPIVGDLDVAGWDLRKALTLLLKPNPVLLEWLSSPIRYRWREEACDALLALAAQTAPALACRHHYLSLSEAQRRRHDDGGPTVRAKKYFYVLRPALALRWLRLGLAGAPPMNLQALASGVSLSDAALSEINELVRQKALTGEAGRIMRPMVLERLIDEEITSAKEAPEGARSPDLGAAADALFRKLVRTFDQRD